MKRHNCRSCYFYDWDFITNLPVETENHFCGLHGGEAIEDPTASKNLDNHGGCGYAPKEQPQQLQLWE